MRAGGRRREGRMDGALFSIARMAGGKDLGPFRADERRPHRLPCRNDQTDTPATMAIDALFFLSS